MSVQKITIEHGYTVDIAYDQEPESPREWGNLTTMAYTSGRYVLGDVRMTSSEIAQIQNKPDTMWLPVYAYIHGSTALSTEPFGCPWDSGQCGIIYVSKEQIKREYGWKYITGKRYQKIMDILRSEVDLFHKYLNGYIYRYSLKNPKGVDVDSCGGFFGYDHTKSGLLESARVSLVYDWPIFKRDNNILTCDQCGKELKPDDRYVAIMSGTVEIDLQQDSMIAPSNTDGLFCSDTCIKQSLGG